MQNNSLNILPNKVEQTGKMLKGGQSYIRASMNSINNIYSKHLMILYIYLGEKTQNIVLFFWEI